MESYIEEKENREGIEWVYRYRKRPENAMEFQELAHVFFNSTYKCDRCGHVFHKSGEDYPFKEEECILGRCSNPSLITVIFRQLKGEKISGLGRLIKVEVTDWKK